MLSLTPVLPIRIIKSPVTPPSPSPSLALVQHGCISERFGARLHFLRKRAGMTQVQLSNHLGIDRSFISDVERGHKTISLSYLETIAQGFQISLSELMKDL